MWLTSWWVAWFLNFYGFSHIYKLHGILSNSMKMLWHSMELHQYFREPHGIPWNSTIFHGIPWTPINTSWNSMNTPWNSMVFHGTPWILPGYSMEVPWNSIDFHQFPWNSTDFHRFPWSSMEFHGIPWRYFTRERPKHQCYITIMLLYKCKK